jgi:hypothetical protein
MSNEVRELKEHTRWLEDELICGDFILDKLGEIEDAIDKHTTAIDRIVDAINKHASVLRRAA